MIVGAVKYLAEEDKTRLTIDLISNEAVTTSEIEGEMLNRDSVLSSIRRNFGLDTDNRKVSPAEHGIAAMMTDLYRHYEPPLSDTLARMFREGLEGFKGGLSAENYLKITNTSRATATRDL